MTLSMTHPVWVHVAVLAVLAVTAVPAYVFVVFGLVRWAVEQYRLVEWFQTGLTLRGKGEP